MNNIHLFIRIFIVSSVFLAPWWISLIIGLSALFYYENYYEIILLGLIWDVLYHSQTTVFGLYGFTILAIGLFLIVKQIKKRLILY